MLSIASYRKHINRIPIKNVCRKTKVPYVGGGGYKCFLAKLGSNKAFIPP
jgi:hypothetical protein